jgi:tyrosine-specific transport protein
MTRAKGDKVWIRIWYNTYMKEDVKKFLRGVFIMTGMIIGVGMFGVPYVLAKAGALAGLTYFIVLGAIMVLNHLAYGETLLRTGGNHRLAGLAEIYLGKLWKHIAAVVTTLSFYGAIIAYIIVGGMFLKTLLSPFFGGDIFAYQVIFFTAMAFMIFIGLRIFASAQTILTAALLAILALIVFLGIWKISPANFTPIDFKDFFLPYGVILFSIGGAAAIPEIIETMGRDKKKVRDAVLWGSVAGIGLIAAFSFTALGIGGKNTGADALALFSSVFGGWFGYIGAAFGLLAVATSFLPLGLYLKEQFQYDFKINGIFSWTLACFIPFFMFLFGTRDFIKVIGFTGAVFAGVEGIMMSAVYLKARLSGRRKPEYSLSAPSFIFYIIMLIFALGMIYEVQSFF